MSNSEKKLADLFMGVIGKPAMTIIEVPELGRVGVRTSMLLGERSKFYAERTSATANALLLQKTVCDAVTGELVLDGFTLDQVNSLPTHVVDPLLDAAFSAIGIKKSDIQKKVEEDLESQELKNSENDQN